jgi:hypothetical protein
MYFLVKFSLGTSFLGTQVFRFYYKTFTTSKSKFYIYNNFIINSLCHKLATQVPYNKKVSEFHGLGLQQATAGHRESL